MSVPRPATDPVQVVQLLVGTLGGCASLGLCFYWFWGIAWIIPAVFSAVLLPWPPCGCSTCSTSTGRCAC